MAGSCDAKWGNAGCHFSDACENVFFNILLVSSCSAKKTLTTCTALLPRSCIDPGMSMLQEHGAILGMSLRCHCMDLKAEMSMVCFATPQESLPSRASVVPCRDCPVTQGNAVCHCQCLGVTFLPHTQPCPAGSLRLGED